MPGGYSFGPFAVDRVKRRLWRNGRAVPITAKTFDVLVVLLEHRDGIVSKEELLNRVWPNTTVQENNLVRQISSLRRALGQHPDQHDYIVTIPGHGYRFVARVHELSNVSGELPTSGDGYSSQPHDAGSDFEHAHPLSDQPASGGDTAVRTLASGRSRQWISIWAAVVLSGAILTILVVIALTQTANVDRDARRTLQRITYDAASLPREAAWAPDGEWVVYASDRGGIGNLWKQRRGDPDPVRLTNSEANESQPNWSPDGRWIVFRSERDGGGLYVIPVNGGVERVVSGFGYDPLWSPDGTHILFKRSMVVPDLPSIYVVGLDGKPPRPVRPEVIGQFTALHAAWHPDGTRVSIWGTVAKRELKFLTVPLDGGSAIAAQIDARVERELKNLTPGKFVWAPSGRHMFFEAHAGETRNVWRISVDPSTEKWIDGPERLTTGADEDTDVALSPDGTRLLFTATSNRTRLWAFPVDPATGHITGQTYPITHGSTGEVDFDARSDGSKVAYRTVRAGRNELWERSITEGQERLLLSSPDWQLMKPRWSPDGAKLAFSRCAARDNGLAVAVLNTDGGGERVLTKADVEMQAFDWSKDGQAILGACRFGQNQRYSTCLVAVSSVRQAADPSVRVIASDPQRNLFNQRFSPDQRWITFLAHDLMHSSTSTIYVTSSAGGPWKAVTDGMWFDDKPRWGPDGKVLYFVSNRSGTANVWGRRFDTAIGQPVGEPFSVTSFRSAQFQLTSQTVQMDIAITSTHLLLPMSEARSDIWMLDHVDR